VRESERSAEWETDGHDPRVRDVILDSFEVADPSSAYAETAKGCGCFCCCVENDTFEDEGPTEVEVWEEFVETSSRAFRFRDFFFFCFFEA